jgi:hypothetical protein
MPLERARIRFHQTRGRWRGLVLPRLVDQGTLLESTSVLGLDEKESENVAAACSADGKLVRVGGV